MIEELLDQCDVETGGLGRDLLLSWDEVMEMSGKGIAFGSHSVSHPCLTNISLEQAKDEIVQSKKVIEEKLGKRVSSFSYPFGAYNLEIGRLVKESGLKCGVLAYPSKLVGPNVNVYSLPRIKPVNDFNKLRGILAGLVEDVYARMPEYVISKIY